MKIKDEAEKTILIHKTDVKERNELIRSWKKTYINLWCFWTRPSSGKQLKREAIFNDEQAIKTLPWDLYQ